MSDAELTLAIAELQEVVRCRCDEAYRDRGLKDPHCECDSAEAVKIVANRIKALTEQLAAARQDAEEAEAYAEELEAENNLLKTSGIIEVAVRNPSVMEYMQHWEGRAETAEAKLAKAVESLERVASITVHSGGEIHGVTAQHWRTAFEVAQDEATITLAEIKGEKP